MMVIGRWDGGAATRRDHAFFSPADRIAAGAGRLLARVLAISGLLAALQLASSLYMLAVFDHVLPASSVTALAVLTTLVCALHVSYAVLDHIRAHWVCQAGLALVERLDGHVLGSLEAGDAGHGMALLNDVERVRGFLTGAGPCAVLDLLWLPAFLVVVFFLHPALGLFASAATLLLAGLSLPSVTRDRGAGHDLMSARARRYVLAQKFRGARGAMAGALLNAGLALRWRALSRAYSETTFSVASRVISTAALGKGVRLALQSVGMGLCALLVIAGSLGPGALFAASLMLGRTFACLDGAIAHGQGFFAARESYRRLVRAIPSPTERSGNARA